jgi:hypothetical protein
MAANHSFQVAIVISVRFSNKVTYIVLTYSSLLFRIVTIQNGQLKYSYQITNEVEVVIFDPPAAPVTIRTFPEALSTTMAGLMEDKGRFPGLMKLLGDGGRLKSLVMLGDEKSSISSLKMIPVEGDMIPDPKLKRKINVKLFIF